MSSSLIKQPYKKLKAIYFSLKEVSLISNKTPHKSKKSPWKRYTYSKGSRSTSYKGRKKVKGKRSKIIYIHDE